VSPALVPLTGAVLPYEIPHFNVLTHPAKVDIPFGIWRGVGLLPNAFGMESFIDELAAEAEIDPLQFRLNNLLDSDLGKRTEVLLRDVGERSQWGQPLPEGHGRGVATSMMAGAVVAAVVHVSISGLTIKVEHVYVAVDAGLIINPAGAKLQIAGAVMMALSSSLHERVSFENGMAVQDNFEAYRLLGAPEAPPVDISLLGTGDTPAGLGEPAIGPIAPALGNAIFAAIGVRVRALPFVLELPG
jgi:isoquinoline 1-oxidoreductase subunit beta